MVLVVPSRAEAEDFSACWVAETVDRYGIKQIVTRCRITGGEVIDYDSDATVPARLHPNVGSDLVGECWFLTSASTNWVYISLFVNGDRVLGWDPDPTTPGGIALATNRIPRCTSEPNPSVDPVMEVWEYVNSYIHAPPTPDLSPTPGDGVTGLDTYIGLPIPEDHQARLNSATGVILDVVIDVTLVIVDWGDGDVDSMLADEDAFAGYPDGAVAHVYETKDGEGYNLTVSYDWTAKWRVVGSPWEFLVVPNTTTAVNYPVAEIVSVITP
jgi:hypothetical protein